MDFFLTIAASDNSGGAGIQQDIRVAQHFNYWALSAITGITAQNFNILFAVEPTSPHIFNEQLEKSFQYFDIDTIKIGAICSGENLNIIIKHLKNIKNKYILLDTVLAATNGAALFDNNFLETMKKELFPLVGLITPNKSELLSGEKCSSFSETIDIAKQKSKEWNTAIFIKGGHFQSDMIREAIISESETFLFERKRQSFQYQHGTGCTISSAMACAWAKTNSIEKAYLEATKYLTHFFEQMNNPPRLDYKNNLKA